MLEPPYPRPQYWQQRISEEDLRHGTTKVVGEMKTREAPRKIRRGSSAGVGT